MTMTLKQVRNRLRGRGEFYRVDPCEERAMADAIDAHLRSQAAEIERLRANNDKLHREHVALQNATVAAESRLAAVNARLEATERTLERCKEVLDTISECWRLDAERLSAAKRASKMDTDELKHLKTKLKQGEYDGTDIMQAWIAIDELVELRNHLVGASTTEPVTQGEAVATYQDTLRLLEARKCPSCRGSGKCNDVEPGDISYREWKCTSCDGSGFTTPPAQPAERIAEPTSPNENAYGGECAG